MSNKINEIYQLYSATCDEISGDLQDISNFIERLLDTGMETYFRMNLPISYKGKDEKYVDLRRSLYLEDNFWHTNVEVNLFNHSSYWDKSSDFSSYNRNYCPPNKIKFSLLAKRSPDAYIVRIAGFKEEFKIGLLDSSSLPERTAFYDFFFEKVKEYYRGMPDYLSNYAKLPDRLGENT